MVATKEMSRPTRKRRLSQRRLEPASLSTEASDILGRQCYEFQLCLLGYLPGVPVADSPFIAKRGKGSRLQGSGSVFGRNAARDKLQIAAGDAICVSNRSWPRLGRSLATARSLQGARRRARAFGETPVEFEHRAPDCGQWTS